MNNNWPELYFACFSFFHTTKKQQTFASGKITLQTSFSLRHRNSLSSMNMTSMTAKWPCLVDRTTDWPSTCPIKTVTRELQIKAQTSNILQSSKRFSAWSCCYLTRMKHTTLNCSVEESGIKYQAGKWEVFLVSAWRRISITWHTYYQCKYCTPSV